jgi:hypothetical protein
VQVRISVNSDMGATTMSSRQKMLGHTGGRGLRRLVLVVVYVRIKMFVSLGLVALLEHKKKVLRLEPCLQFLEKFW